jgi:4-carboxymuconolactone decarboxylase
MTILPHFGIYLTVPYLLAALFNAAGLSSSNSINMSNNQEHVDTSSDFVARYNGPSVEEMTPKQGQIRDSILASRKGTGLSGPFGPWLAVPEIAEPAQELGRACRYGTSLSFRESELVILLTGAKTKSHAEFDIHVGEALKAGLTMEIINAIPRDDDFTIAGVKEKVVPLLANEREVAIVMYTSELVDTYSVSDETYETTKAALDGKDSALVEITSIAGYYTYVSYTLNAFRIPTKKN